MRTIALPSEEGADSSVRERSGLQEGSEFLLITAHRTSNQARGLETAFGEITPTLPQTTWGQRGEAGHFPSSVIRSKEIRSNFPEPDLRNWPSLQNDKPTRMIASFIFHYLDWQGQDL
jgi:hypothetical protein